MKTIMIDPGHGGSDSGAVFGQLQEKTLNLSLALKVRDYLLNFYQVQIMMTRTTDKTVSLPQRTNLANEKNVDYFCSLHTNAGGGTGWESYIYNGNVSSETVNIRSTIHNTAMTAIEPYSVIDRGQKRANFHVLRETTMPSILMENLFIDHQQDILLLKNPAFITDLSTGIAKGLAAALELPLRVMYKVIAGSFESRDNANTQRALLTAKGIDSFIVEQVISGVHWYRVQVGAFQDRANADARLKKVVDAGFTDAFIIKE